MLKFIERKMTEGSSNNKEKYYSRLTIEIKGSKIIVNGNELDDDALVILRRGKYVDVASGKTLDEAISRLSQKV